METVIAQLVNRFESGGLTRRELIGSLTALVAMSGGSAPQPASYDIGDLALTEVPVPPASRSDTMAVILTGDGGWAELDKSVAEAFASRGVPSVGWSSLRINKDRSAWNGRALALHDAAMLAVKAADAHDPNKIFEVGENIEQACENCHRQYWYPNEQIPEPPKF